MFEIVRPGTQIDFIGRWKLCASLSLALILLSAVAIPLRGLRLGIDFAGGNEIQVRFADVEVEEGRIRTVVQGIGIEDASVVRFGGEEEREFLIRFRGGLDETKANRLDPLRLSLTEQLGELTILRVETVGPRVGGELRRDGLLALLMAFGAILVYVAFRFSARFSPGAVVAVVHDVLVTSGIWVLLGFEFDLRVLAALLAIIGYSLNDTIIVYDRIRENLEIHTGVDLPEVLNRSVNQTLSRTILTSGTTLVAVVSLWLVGGEVIRPFAIAMAIGIVVGTYSSIYIAAPTLLLLENRFGDAAGGGAQAQRPKPAKAKA
ncbi:MAG: protein translocase subunit SecF [Myxococcota bacterium]